MIVEYGYNPQRPDGEGRIFRELLDGEPFTFLTDATDPARRRARTCIATNLVDARATSSKPYDRRLAVDLADGSSHWLAPETPVVTAPVRVAAR